MFSVKQKREIADAVQKILRDTNHPELPTGEIQFSLHVDGAESWSWANILNNGVVTNPGINPWNEKQDKGINENERMV
jgi:peroxiredoxin